MVKCQGLVKYYRKTLAVDHLSFEVKKGEIFGLIGPNGAGKTTTIKMLLGLTRPTAGKIQIKSGIQIGYSPETPYFPGFLTAEEVLYFYGKLQRLKKTQLVKEISIILKKVNLIDYRTRKIQKFSKGMLQRLALAQALLGSPDLLILDEPAAGLDAKGRIEILNLIKELKEEGKTIILNSHILHDVEQVADRGIILNRGRLVTEWDFRQKMINLEISCTYDSDILEALKSIVKRITPTSNGFEVELLAREQIPDIAKMIIMGGGKIYELKETRNLEKIFLQALGGVR
ncbi:ABC transporter ATP-binding protein [Anoxybacter fermentans]|nr:ABC transporter ATP-binding protein [Anoxybacter fermentans]